MRSFLWLSILAVPSAAFTDTEQSICALDASESVSDALDASLFLWAASKRCTKKGEETKCEVDVTSALKSTNSMINIILAAVKECNGLNTANRDCGLQAGKFTEHISALAAAAGGVAQKCANTKSSGSSKSLSSPVLCTVNLKNTAKDLFSSVRAISNVKNGCTAESMKTCSENSLAVVSALSGFGQFMAGSVGQCKRAATKKSSTVDTRGDLCAQASLALIEYTSKVASDGLKLSELCGRTPPTARLFEHDGHEKLGKKGGSVMTLVFGAFIPIFAIMGFSIGRRQVRR